MSQETENEVLDERGQQGAEEGHPDEQQPEAQESGDDGEGKKSEADAATSEADDDDAGEELTITIGEDSELAPEDNEDELRRAPQWVRDLRKRTRDLEREKREHERKNRELAEELERIKNGGKSGLTLGEKPTLEACDFDTERFERELTAWYERKRQVDEVEAKKREAAENEKKAWQARQEAYTKAKSELKVKDFEDAESLVTGMLNVTQQGVILHGADNPALVVYALYKNPKKAGELAAIADPVKFAFAIAKLETQLKVQPRKAPPPPEKRVQGSAPVVGAVDSHLERLRAEADRTGDRTKIAKYLRDKRQK